MKEASLHRPCCNSSKRFIQLQEFFMVKADVVRRVRLETGVSQGEAEELINELLEIMRCTLESGENLMVTNFGLFELKDKVERPGRDPKSKVEHRIDARRVISFHPAKTWREELNQ